MRNVWILGTGKMAADIGTFLLTHNCPVTWLSESSEYLASLKKSVEKTMRRIRKYPPDTITCAEPSFYTYRNVAITSADIIIECTNESLEKKKKVLSFINEMITDDVILLSNSSSILPGQIHPACLGCHFFYPVALTACVELIGVSSAGEHKRNDLLQFLTECDLSIIMQTEKNAFAANRLLLPLQNELFRLLQAGYPPHLLDAASSTPIMPIGQLTFIDSVGIDTVYAGVRNYISRMTEHQQHEYTPLTSGLKEMIRLGKLGRKNKNGLLTGEQLPWPVTVQASPEEIHRRLIELFIGTCRQFLTENTVSESDMHLILSFVFQSDISL